MNETELKKLLDEAIKRQFDFDDNSIKTDNDLLKLAIAEDFFIAGYKAAIAERANFEGIAGYFVDKVF